MDIVRESLEKILNMGDYPQFTGICIWGGGNTTELYQNSLERENIEPLYYIDKDVNKRGMQFRIGGSSSGVIHPSEIKTNIEGYENILFLSSSAVPKTNQVILNEIADMGLHGMSYEQYILGLHKDKVLKVYDLLEDDLSKITYAEVVTARVENREVDEKIYNDKLYFCLKQFIVEDFSQVFVDVGAFVGDTTEQYIKTKLGIFSKIFCFEPQESNYNALSYRVKRLKKEWGLSNNKIVTERLGIGNKKGYITEVSPSEGSNICAGFQHTDEFENSVELTTIDDYFKDISIGFLKADIESYEYGMLLSAEKIIKRDSPLMAMSIYHNPSDLFDIPLLIKEYNSNYKFKVRHHTYVNADTVLYAYL